MMYSEYKRLAVKPQERKAWIKYLLRPISTLISYAIKDVRFISPNNVTALMIFLVLFSGFLGIKGYYGLMAILLISTSILDGVDGELARYRDLVSKDGMALDNIYHLICFPSIMTGIGISLNKWAGISAMVVSLMFMANNFMREIVSEGYSVKKGITYYLGQIDQDHNFNILVCLGVLLVDIRLLFIAFMVYTFAKSLYIYFKVGED